MPLQNGNDVTDKNNRIDVKHDFIKPTQANNTLDIYNDVYMNDKIGLLACKRYDENGKPKPYTQEEFTKVILYNLTDSTDYKVKLKTEVTEEEKKNYRIIIQRPHRILKTVIG